MDQKERKKRGYGKDKAPEENIAPVEDIVGNKEEALKRYRINPISNTQDEDTDVGSILKDTSNIRQVGTIDPIADFNAMINNKKEDLITEGIVIDTATWPNYHILKFFHVLIAVQQMSTRIEQLVKDSFADQYFEKAITCLKLLRDQCKMVSISFSICCLPKAFQLNLVRT